MLNISVRKPEHGLCRLGFLSRDRSQRGQVRRRNPETPEAQRILDKRRQPFLCLRITRK